MEPRLAQDSSKPDFWESRYRDNLIPWDAGKVPASLQEYARNLSPGAQVLIPGCGSAYEAAFLSDKGCDVLAIDFSPAAVEAARKNLAGFGDIVRVADFFEFDEICGDAIEVRERRSFSVLAGCDGFKVYRILHLKNWTTLLIWIL